MIRLWPIGLILLGFPLLELWTAIVAARYVGWWLLLWFIGAAIAGVALIREERFAVLGRVLGAVQQGRDPFRAMLTSGRLMLAGLLLIVPGLITDAIALVLLLWPRPRYPMRAANDEVIDGEFRREEGKTDRIARIPPDSPD